MKTLFIALICLFVLFYKNVNGQDKGMKKNTAEVSQTVHWQFSIVIGKDNWDSSYNYIYISELNKLEKSGFFVTNTDDGNTYSSSSRIVENKITALSVGAQDSLYAKTQKFFAITSFKNTKREPNAYNLFITFTQGGINRNLSVDGLEKIGDAPQEFMDLLNYLNTLLKHALNKKNNEGVISI